MFTVFNYSSGQTYTGILDTLNNVSDCKFDFSPYKRLTGTYTGNKIYIERLSDNAKDTITTSDYDSNGDINSSEITTWAGGGDVVLLDCYSETQSGKKAYQTDNTKAPKIVVGGVWQSDGSMFDGNDYMVIDKYSALNITNYPITIYVNRLSTTSDGYLFFVNDEAFTPNQFGVRNTNGTNHRFYLGGNEVINTTVSTTDKIINTWSGEGANEVLHEDSSDTANGTKSGSLPEYPNVTIGARHNTGITYSHYLNANIKSILIFNTNEYSNYAALVSAGI